MFCIICHKKMGLLGFECKCHNVFCSKHRLPEDHVCPVRHGKDICLLKTISDKLKSRV